MSEFLTTKQLADKLGVSYQTIVKWRRAQRDGDDSALPPQMSMRGHPRYSKAAVQEWIQRRSGVERDGT